jgi:hypothetical protein
MSIDSNYIPSLEFHTSFKFPEVPLSPPIIQILSLYTTAEMTHIFSFHDELLLSRVQVAPSEDEYTLFRKLFSERPPNIHILFLKTTHA